MLVRNVSPSAGSSVIALMIFAIVGANFDVYANDQPAQPPPQRQCTKLLNGLADDSPRVRENSKHELLTIGSQLSHVEREAFSNELLKQTATASLDVRDAVNWIAEEVRANGLERDIDAFVQSLANSIPHDITSHLDDSPTRWLASAWHCYTQRVGNSGDCRDVFAVLAKRAGRDLPRDHLSDALLEQPFNLIQHISLCTPQAPRLYVPESRRLLQQIHHYDGFMPRELSATPRGRVLNRALDHLLTTNPYGWTIDKRLDTALRFHRDHAAMNVIDAIFDAQHSTPRDTALAILAFTQLSLHSDCHGNHEWTEVIRQKLTDYRSIAVVPGKLVRAHPVQLHAIRWNADLIRTRVQDVAAWSFFHMNRLDAREYGMQSLQADPIWGVRMPSVGFASDDQRQQTLAVARDRLKFPAEHLEPVR